LGLHVTGVDISPGMLGMAEPGAAAFVQVAPAGRLPFAAASFDLLWTCTVLQHIPEAAFALVVSELRRVLRPGAALLLCENTNPGPRTSRSGHVVFRSPDEYVLAFPGLSVAGTFTSDGERHTIFSGRLAGSDL
jgi:ubiquinone/menaquinone biosynthesis C-methylase UbiE